MPLNLSKITINSQQVIQSSTHYHAPTLIQESKQKAMGRVPFTGDAMVVSDGFPLLLHCLLRISSLHSPQGGGEIGDMASTGVDEHMRRPHPLFLSHCLCLSLSLLPNEGGEEEEEEEVEADKEGEERDEEGFRPLPLSHCVLPK